MEVTAAVIAAKAMAAERAETIGRVAMPATRHQCRQGIKGVKQLIAASDQLWWKMAAIAMEAMAMALTATGDICRR